MCVCIYIHTYIYIHIYIQLIVLHLCSSKRDVDFDPRDCICIHILKFNIFIYRARRDNDINQRVRAQLLPFSAANR